jgi:hypothetical protein
MHSLMNPISALHCRSTAELHRDTSNRARHKENKNKK